MLLNFMHKCSRFEGICAPWGVGHFESASPWFSYQLTSPPKPRPIFAPGHRFSTAKSVVTLQRSWARISKIPHRLFYFTCFAMSCCLQRCGDKRCRWYNICFNFSKLVTYDYLMHIVSMKFIICFSKNVFIEWEKKSIMYLYLPTN